jgi:hypothetical protein
VRVSVLTYEDRGHSLARDSRRIQILEKAQVAVAMHVDEAGRKRKPVFVSDGLARLGIQVLRNRRDAVALNANVGREGRLARPVINTDISQEDVSREEVHAKRNQAEEDQ